jgi:hypothetical protein
VAELAASAEQVTASRLLQGSMPSYSFIGPHQKMVATIRSKNFGAQDLLIRTSEHNFEQKLPSNIGKVEIL